MAEYHLAPSLVALRNEVNRRWPNRDKSSDGWIGDASHSARKSDHNPDYSAGGVVRAIDVDKDGIDVTQLLDAVLREPRVAYVIWNRRIASATQDGTPWNWEPYDGENDHTHHVHISIKHTPQAASDTSPWFANPPATEDDLMAAREDILNYQKACTIQIQDNTRQLLNLAVGKITEAVQTYAVAVNEYTRQIDSGSDTEMQAALDKLKADLSGVLKPLDGVTAGAPEIPQ